MSRSIPSQTKKELFKKSGNKCAFPDCKENLIDEDVLIGNICHIVPFNDLGPRGSEGASKSGLAVIDNLIVLCANHHKLIDSKPLVYTEEWLINAKKNHEKIVEKSIANSTLAMVNTSTIKAGSFHEALDIWENNKDNGDEEFWQNFFAENPKIIAQAIPKHIIKIGEKCYVGGKSITNKGGNIIDFLFATPKTRNVVLVEIKTPLTQLIGSKYRNNAYSLTEELSGSVIQVLNYKYELEKNFLSLAHEEGMEFETFDPKCLVVVGNLDRENMNSIQKKSFELYRANSNVEIVTYDELFGKVEDLIDIIEG